MLGARWRVKRENFFNKINGLQPAPATPLGPANAGGLSPQTAL